METRYFQTFGTQVNICFGQVTYPDEMLGEMMETSWEDIDIYPQTQSKALPNLQTQDITGIEVPNLKEDQWLKCQESYHSNG